MTNEVLRTALKDCGQDIAKRNEFILGLNMLLTYQPEYEYDLSDLGLYHYEWEKLLTSNHPSVRQAAIVARTDAYREIISISIDAPDVEVPTSISLVVTHADQSSDVVVIPYTDEKDQVLIIASNSLVKFDKNLTNYYSADTMLISQEAIMCKKHVLPLILELIATNYAHDS